MKYEDFEDKVVALIQEKLPDKKLVVEQVTKSNNIIKRGLCIRSENSNISPTFYISDYYNAGYK